MLNVHVVGLARFRWTLDCSFDIDRALALRRRYPGQSGTRRGCEDDKTGG